MIDLPPQNIEAEKAVLASAMILPEAARWAIHNLEAQHFYLDRHREVFKAMASVSSDGEPVEFFTVSDRLQKLGKLADCGGRLEIMGLEKAISTALNFDYYGREVLRCFHDREMINLALKIGQFTREQNAEDRDKALEKMREISKNRDGLSNGHFISFDEAINQAFDGFDKGPGHLIPTGIEYLDRIITGLDDGDLMVIAGRPGSGKTVAGLNIGVNMALAGKRVAFFSGEMKAAQIILRTMSASSGVEHWRLRARKFEAGQMKRIMDAIEPFRGIPLGFYQKSSPNIRDIASFADSYKADVVVVDYLTQCEMPRAESKRLGIAEFMMRLKNMGRDSGRRIILNAQLNRLTDREPDRRPTLSDLAESGSIEHTADFVTLIYQTQEEKVKDDSIAEFIIAKGRGTSTGVAMVPWHRPTMRLGQSPKAKNEQIDFQKAAAGDFEEGF